MLVALDIGDLLRVLLGGGLGGVDGHDIGVIGQLAVIGERQGGDDVVLIGNGLVNPGIVAAAVDHEQVRVLGLGDIGRGRLEVVRVNAVALDDGLDLDVHAGGGIGHGLGDVGPDGGGRDDGNLLLGARLGGRVLGVGRAGGGGQQEATGREEGLRMREVRYA